MVKEAKQTPRVRLGIAVPTYNEVNNLEELVGRIESALKSADVACTILVIDDNSPDGTGDLAVRLAKVKNSKNFDVHVLHRKNKQGLGAAYIAGFKELLQEDYTHILQMDADLSHNPNYIPALLEAAKSADLVVGSRYILGGGSPDWSIYRKFMSYFGNLYARLLLGNKIHDYTGGFNLYSSAVLKRLNFNSLEAPGYGFLIELKYRTMQQASSVAEVPILFTDRVHGQSKIPKSTIIRTLLLVPKLRFFS